MMDMQNLSSEITDHNHAAGSYITFSSCDTQFALSVGFVRYITTVQALTKRTSPTKEGLTHTVFDFGGETLVLYDFNQIIDAASHCEIIEELIGLLAARREDHIKWIAALEHSIHSGEPFTKAIDPHQCAFGIWYDNYKPSDHELQKILENFDEPHKAIHALAEELLSIARDKGDIAEAEQRLEQEKRSTLKQLLNLFDEATQRLEALDKPVVLVLDDGTRKFGLQVESIGDIKQFDAKAWLPDQKRSVDRCYEGFFQTPGDELFLNIVPQRLLQQTNNS
ncbi:chemoreceptor zinc-binding protein [Alteromonadaceae bacterium 2753L.S.0a.02]|nr:chemoreceptor zinc-binding protein [Alteromonadaceae bacterium 2753L.S.0a.02]